MWENVHPVFGDGIRTHDLQDMSLLSPITTRPGLPPTWVVIIILGYFVAKSQRPRTYLSCSSIHLSVYNTPGSLYRVHFKGPRILFIAIVSMQKRTALWCWKWPLCQGYQESLHLGNQRFYFHPNNLFGVLNFLLYFDVGHKQISQALSGCNYSNTLAYSCMIVTKLRAKEYG